MPISLRSNILYAFLEKGILMGGQFFVIFLYIRLLPRAEFGYLGVAAGIFTLINFLNFNFEPLIIRFRKDSGHTFILLKDILTFNYLKSSVIIFSIIIISLYYFWHGEPFKAYALISVGAITLHDILAAPFVAYASSGYQQSLCTKISLIRTTTNILATCGLFLWTDLQFLACKDICISIASIILWHIFILRQFPELSHHLRPAFSGALTRLKEHFVGFTFWTHLITVISGFFSRLDVFILSFFVVPSLTGDYNIALTGASLANIIPMIISYQNFVALSTSQSQGESAQLESAFLRASLWISLLSLLCFPILALAYLFATTGMAPDHNILINMILIGYGIIISKSIATPIVAYASTHGTVKKHALTITLPLLAICIPSYFIGAWIGENRGAAIANLVCGLIWAALALLFALRSGYSFPHRTDFQQDLKRLFAKLSRRSYDA